MTSATQSFWLVALLVGAMAAPTGAVWAAAPRDTQLSQLAIASPTPRRKKRRKKRRRGKAPAGAFKPGDKVQLTKATQLKPKPRKRGKTVARLAKGDVLEVVKIVKRTWARVKGDSGTGFVPVALLEPATEAAPAPTVDVAAADTPPADTTPPAADAGAPADSGSGGGISIDLGGDTTPATPAAAAAAGDAPADAAAAGESGGFAIDLNAPADDGAADDGGFAIDLGGGLDIADGGGDGEFTLEFSLGDEGEEGDGVDFMALDLGDVEIKSFEREQFEAALEMAKDEDWEEAADKFYQFVGDEAYKEFHQEAEYQLAKALYKLELFHPALERFKVVLNRGPKHARYKTSVEWVFFISRKIADQTPVLKELAKFRNVTWPKAYRNEFRFLLAKYLFMQAETFEIQRLKDEDFKKRTKKRKASFDFAEFEEAADDWGETFVLKKDDFEDMSVDIGEINLGEDDLSFDLDMDDGMKAETAPLPQTSTEAINIALDMLNQISDKSKFYAQTQYLDGLLRYLAGEHELAIKSFRSVGKLTDPRLARFSDPYLREMAIFTLARVYYEHHKFEMSTRYYDLVDRNSERWLTALFESSWAYFQRGDYEKALGNLVTLHSPFFEDEYFPESQILRAVIYYENCRYPETRDIVTRFIKRVKPVLKYIESIAKNEDPPDKLYEQIDILIKENEDEGEASMKGKVLKLALLDDEIIKARDKVAEIDAQIETLEDLDNSFRATPVYMNLNEGLRAERLTRMRQGGELVKERFKIETVALKGLIRQAFIIRMEVAKKERGIMQLKMKGEPTGVTQRPYEATVAVDDESVYWPYENEYWRDELGTYEYTLSWGCRPER